jgi:uncharacterized phage-associated protein
MTYTEEKILNAIKYFVKKTKYVGRTKLFKLLYFWDFYYFEKHGKSITGLTYYAWPFGPVPKSLFEQIENDRLPDYLKSEIAIIDDTDYDSIDGYKRFKIMTKNDKINLDVFTPYEKQELERVVEIFEDATAQQMTEASHYHNMPWAKTIKEKGEFAEIDYMLGKSKDTPFDEEEIKERMFLQKQLTHNGNNREGTIFH